MATRKSKLAVLAMSCTLGIGSSTPVVAQNPSDVGAWGDVLEWPLMAVHTILLKNGKVLCVYDELEWRDSRFMLFDPTVAEEFSTEVIDDRPTSGTDEVLLFCAGHNQLPDGKIMFVGGGLQYSKSHDHTVIYDPDLGACAPWTFSDDMPKVDTGTEFVKGKRWYPVVSKLSDGTMLVVAGQKPIGTATANIPLIYDPKKLEGDYYTELFDAEQYLSYFPFVFQLTDGEVLFGGSNSDLLADHEGPSARSKKLNPITGESWVDLQSFDDPIMGGSAVMFGTDRVMKAGGHVIAGSPPALVGYSEKIYTINMQDASPEWEEFDDFLTYPRGDLYLVALPGGSILAIGGDATGGPGDPDDTLIPELHKDPFGGTGIWEQMAPMDKTPRRCAVTGRTCQDDDDCNNCSYSTCNVGEDECALGEICIFGHCLSTSESAPQCDAQTACPNGGTCITLPTVDRCWDVPRAHHAAALLLPDARVLMAGGDHYMIYLGEPYAAENESAQIFSPPYLYDPITQALAARPVITAVDGPASCDYPESESVITYGQDFTVDFTPPGATILEVNLIALGHASHSYDQHQRFVDLTDDFSWSSGVLTVTPPTAGEAPPGYYMLFILDDSGVPSKAEIIRLHPSCVAEPTVNAPLGTIEPLMNRYVSFKPNNTGEFAFQLELTDSSLFPGSVGENWWVSKPALKDGVYVSSLSASLEYREWTEEVIYVGGCPVVPDATYDLRALSYGGEYSAPVALSTVPEPTDGKKWGDAVSSYDGFEWGPPQGVVNFDDVFAAVKGFTQTSNPPSLPRVDIDPESPNRTANFNDVTQFILAWKSLDYPFRAPEDCFPCVVEVDILGGDDPITFTLIADNPFIDPGEGVEVEVFVDSISDLGGYQVTLEVKGGTSGSLVLTDVTVDTAHPDYVFAGLSDFASSDIPRGRIGNGLIGAESGVVVSDSGYLATFSYVPSEFAVGDFHVEVVVGHDDTSPMNSSATKLAYHGAGCTVIGVGFDCHVDADCDDLNDCTINTCVNDECIVANEASGTTCDDGEYCTATSECDGNGTCVGSGSPCLPKDPVCCELAELCIGATEECAAPQ